MKTPLALAFVLAAAFARAQAPTPPDFSHEIRIFPADVTPAGAAALYLGGTPWASPPDLTYGTTLSFGGVWAEGALLAGTASSLLSAPAGAWQWSWRDSVNQTESLVMSLTHAGTLRLRSADQSLQLDPATSSITFRNAANTVTGTVLTMEVADPRYLRRDVTTLVFGTGSSASGGNAIALGQNALASGLAATAIGYGSQASGEAAVALGLGSFATGENAIAVGRYSQATGRWGAVAMGNVAYATGDIATALGAGSTASGYASTAMGYGTTASYYYATAMGQMTTAAQQAATAMGYYTSALGWGSTSMGDHSVAQGDLSVAQGSHSQAHGLASAAFGRGTLAYGTAQFVVGEYNVPSGTAAGYESPEAIFIIGAGQPAVAPATEPIRANALTVRRNGNARLAGALIVEGGSEAAPAKSVIKRDLDVQGVLRVRPAGDLSMGDFTTGSQP